MSLVTHIALMLLESTHELIKNIIEEGINEHF